VIFNQSSLASGYDLQIRDWVAITPAAGQRLWTFFADHRSLGQSVSWQGPSIDPCLSLLPEQTHQVEQLERWLVRVIDVPKALSLRGYPPEVEAQLHLDVMDPLLPKNTGRYILDVSQGQGAVTTGGLGELQVNIRGLAPLYTGFIHRITLCTSAKGHWPPVRE
jgi:predicted acetyltransferase